MRTRQIVREKAARQAALGKRAAAIEEGHLSPVLKRWISASVVPTATLLKDVAGKYLAGDMTACGELLDSPLFGLAEWGSLKAQPLRPFMHWLLRGESPGRAATTTYAEDLVLAGLGAAIARCAATKHSSDGAGDAKAAGFTVNAILDAMAGTLAETVTGQFLVSIQGATAMQRVREKNRDAWKQGRSLARIVGLLRSQVRGQLRDQELDNPELALGGKRLLSVKMQDGEMRKFELKRTPDEVDWQMLLLAWDGEDPAVKARHRSLWLSLALMILCAAQKESGWFDLTTRAKYSPTMSNIKDRGSKRYRGSAKILVLSEAANAAITKDVEHWVAAGFFLEPMVVKPENNDYLTVKHRLVTGRRGPLGLNTDPTLRLLTPSLGLEKSNNTLPIMAARVLSESPWQVNRHMLSWLRDNERALDPLRAQMGELAVTMTMAAHRRDAAEDALYFPSSMDFRGRMYYRPNWINPQQGSLNKALLQFPPDSCPLTEELKDDAGAEDAVIAHCSGLFGLDKSAWLDRVAWFKGWKEGGYPYAPDADEPLMLQGAALLLRSGRGDQIPCQLDGTCNGLQHLSAMFRDNSAAFRVNLTQAPRDTSVPEDIYGYVAELATARFEHMIGPHPFSRVRWDSGSKPAGWLLRFAEAGIRFDRRTAKRPVMVLPFGGTQVSVIEALKGSLLEQLGDSDKKRRIWADSTHEDAIAGTYATFKDRQLANHPLFDVDCRRLGQMFWDCIAATIPLPMAAMQTFSKIGQKVGQRGLKWQTPSGLWVMQAKSKADRKQVAMRGFHLPNAIRRLTLLAERNEVDPKYHRLGIVANFIHSMDAAHLATVLWDWGCDDFTHTQPIGAIHDCVLVRPSAVKDLGYRLRQNFAAMYRRDPLSNPVWIVDPEGLTMEFRDWYELAAFAGTEFPSKGSWQPEQVLRSAWFFS